MAELSREWLTSLDDYAQGFKEEAYHGAGLATEHLLESVREEARNRPGWDALADNIEVWSEDGDVIIGVHDSAFVSQAFALEFGDETTPPNPLLRTITNHVDEAGEVYSTHLADQGVADR